VYIEFALPTSAHAAGLILKELDNRIAAWSERYAVLYRRKIVKYTLRITFDDEEMYHFFALTWQTASHNDVLTYHLKNFRFVEPK
jgi:hypothetical protein